MTFGPSWIGVIYDIVTQRSKRDEERKQGEERTRLEKKISGQLGYCLPDAQLEVLPGEGISIVRDTREQPGVVLTIDHATRRIVSQRADVDSYLQGILLYVHSNRGRYTAITSRGICVEND